MLKKRIENELREAEEKVNKIIHKEKGKYGSESVSSRNEKSYRETERGTGKWRRTAEI